MASSHTSYQIYMLLSMMTRRLDDHNFIVWSYQFQTLLEGQDLFGYVDGSTICPPKYVITDDEGVTSEISTTYIEWKRIDKAILSLLFASLSYDTMDYVVGNKTSREAWMRLSDLFATFSRSQIMQLKTDLYTITKGMDSVAKYLVKVQRARNQLNALGVTMEDEDIIVVILNGLPAEFNLIKAIIRARESSVSIAELRNLLLNVERDIANRETLNSIPSSSVMRTKKNVSQRCLSGNGNLSQNGRGSRDDFLSPPQCPLTGTSSLHASSNQLQFLLPIHLAKGDSVGTYIGVSPAIVDGEEQNLMNTCSSVNKDSDGYGCVNLCGDDIDGVCFVGKNHSNFGSCAEIQYVDQVSSDSKGLCGETNKFTDFLKDKLRGCFIQEDEMDIIYARDSFLNKQVHMYMDCQKHKAQIDHDCLDPYLTVNIGSIVSKGEAGHSKFHHVSGTIVGSGILWVKTFEAVAGEFVCSVDGDLKVEVQALNHNQVMMMSTVILLSLLSVSKVVHDIGLEALLTGLRYFFVQILQYTVVGLGLMCCMFRYLGQTAHLMENLSGKRKISHRNDVVDGSSDENHGGDAGNNKKNRIVPHHIQLTVHNNEKLCNLLGDLIIANDGGANIVVDDGEHVYDLDNANMGNNAFDAQFVTDSISICSFLFTSLLQFPCELLSVQFQAYQFAQGQASEHDMPTRFKDGFDNCHDLCAVLCVAPTMMKQEISFKHGTFVCSKKFTKELAHGAGIDISTSCLVPCKSHRQMLTTEGSHGTLLNDLSLLRCTVGALQYVSFSRPDTIFVANLLCQFKQLKITQLMSSLKGFIVLHSRCIAPISACCPQLRLRGSENGSVL